MIKKMEEAREKIVEVDPRKEAGPSSLRAWWALVRLSWLRQARLRQMVYFALVVMLFAVAVVAIYTALGAWSMRERRWPFRQGPTLTDWSVETQALYGMLGRSPGGPAVPAAVLGSCRAVLDQSGFLVFAQYAVFLGFVSVLLPLWSLSFATEAIGGERESNTMIWLLTRPLPRPAIYLAKFAALLPWTLGMNLGGFALMCAAAGRPGWLSLRLFWPAVVEATLAYSALFCLMGAYFRRPAVMALLYFGFLEVLFANLPGYLQRVSIVFFTRCLMFEAAGECGVQPQKPSVFLPVEGPTAQAVLLGATAALLVLGTVVFARSQYHEVA
jgi:ABC-2 type transport system permease protein